MMMYYSLSTLLLVGIKGMKNIDIVSLICGELDRLGQTKAAKRMFPYINRQERS